MTILWCVVLTLAADPQTDEALEKSRRAAVAELAPAKAKQVQIAVSDSATAELVPEPLLRWSNPTAGSVHGEVFLWTHEKRPVAIASIYRWYHPFKDCTFEVVSLAQEPLTATDGDKQFWEAPAAGITWRVFPDAAPPAERPTARLVQMRALARRFSAELSDKRGGDEVRRELRLLQQPAHRYATDKEVIDGALLAFVETTDPEVWLLLEAVQSDGGAKWQYALARMNADAIMVELDGKQVAAWEKIVQPWKYSRGHYAHHIFVPAAKE